MRVYIKDIGAHVGQEVQLSGFVHRIRDQKHVQFVMLKDITGMVQVVNEKSAEELAKVISGLSLESAIQVTGIVNSNEKVKSGAVEVQLKDITVVHEAAAVPIQADSTLEKQMDFRWISLRDPRNQLIFKVQTDVERGMRDYWERNGFLEIHSPKLMGTASESGAELFQMEYFETTASLAQSPQFYKQMAMAAGFDKIFEIGPVFRANPSFTSRHDTEFTSVDMEISWITSHEDVMRLEEEWLHHVLQYVAQRHGDAIKQVFDVDVVVPTLPFPRISLSKAREILAERGHVINHKDDLDPPGERLLAEYVQETYGHEFCFVTDYPIEVRPFYHMRHPEDPSLTKSFDLLWKGLEITTGAQREHRPEILAAQAEEKGIHLAEIATYIDFFRYGSPPHGGLGLGLTRVLMVLLGVRNVREVTYLYRGPNRLTP